MVKEDILLRTATNLTGDYKNRVSQMHLERKDRQTANQVAQTRNDLRLVTTAGKEILTQMQNMRRCYHRPTLPDYLLTSRKARARRKQEKEPSETRDPRLIAGNMGITLAYQRNKN